MNNNYEVYEENKWYKDAKILMFMISLPQVSPDLGPNFFNALKIAPKETQSKVLFKVLLKYCLR